MKGWGDEGGNSGAAASSTLTRAVAVESSAISTNFDDPPPATGSSAAASPPPEPENKTAFGRRAARPAASATGGASAEGGITDITEIPDLEEEAREPDLTTAVAEAPNVRTNRVQALQELDQQILFQLPSAIADGIDLSLLTAALAPQENVRDTCRHATPRHATPSR